MNLKVDPTLLESSETATSAPHDKSHPVADDANALLKLFADNVSDDQESAAQQEVRPLGNIPVLIVSAIAGHAYFAQPVVQQKAALGDNGVLYLTEGAEQDVLVLDYIARLERRALYTEGREVPFHTRRTVPYSEIQRLNAQAAEAENLSAVEIARKTAEEAQGIAIITEAARLEATDIFFEMPSRDRAQIRYRIAGDMEFRLALKPERMNRLMRTIFESMCEAKSDPNYDPTRDQTARIASTFLEGLGLHRCRVSCGPTEDERSLMAIRLHYDIGEPKTLVELGFTADHQDMLYNVAGYSSGIGLFTGPTGCGKTVTLTNIASYWQQTHNFQYQILTLEDPPEIPILGAIQKDVSRKGGSREEEGRAWISGFDTLMRWNPDWIIAGELRLKETMDAALKSALTNHLTWGSLHASSATLALVRLLESGIDMGYLCDPEIFRIFVNQSLAPQLCPHCSKPYADGAQNLAPGLRRRIESFCMPDSVRLRNPQGCEFCHRGARRKRMILAEVFPTDSQSLDVFRKKGASELRKFWVHERGGKTKTSHLIEKVNAGLIDPSDAERIVSPLDADNALRI